MWFIKIISYATHKTLGLKNIRETQINHENKADHLLVNNKYLLSGERYIRGMAKTSKKHFINRKDPGKE